MAEIALLSTVIPTSVSTEQANVSIEKQYGKESLSSASLQNSIKGILETTLITRDICQK